MKQLFVSLALLSIFGCASEPNPTPVPAKAMILYRYPMNEIITELAHQLAAHDLKDPESAKFRDTFFVSSDGRGEGRDKSKDSMCVEVNGKNSYGAYVGYAWTMIPVAGSTVITSVSPLAGLAAQICSSAVYTPT